MKANLSSQIKLERIPRKYYASKDPYERIAITRFERIPTEIFESAEEGAAYVAADIVKSMTAHKKMGGGNFVVALGVGNGTRAVYAELVRLHKEEKVSFSNMVVFNVSEYYPLNNEANGKAQQLHEMFLDQVDIKPKNIFTIDSTIDKNSIFDFCRAYEQNIDNYGGIDLAFTEIGALGALGFNDPGSQVTSATRLVLLGNDHLREAATINNGNQQAPQSAITMGISTLLASKEMYMVAWGEDRAAISRSTIEDKVNDSNPAAYMQQHKNAKVVLDLSAAEELTRINTPWLVTSCEWDDIITRRAIVWLCMQTGKPILKLTNKDYNEHALNELLALYGSAYNVNIKIFNDLQHTITGWPGGKPNADDTHRPERATPYPKRIIIFSPHPDDDVISMGGTFKRLVDQKHDVHVAYETSGSIAVGDEDMMRYVMLMSNISKKFNFENEELTKQMKTITDFVANKKNGDIDLPEIQYLKAAIRRGEARTACNYIGVNPDNIHFLNLPFYETGAIKKGDLSDADVTIVRQLINEIQPHEIFVAGDLADPHGTHKVCLDAVLAALDEEKDSEWIKNCRIWMYRGAWAEWEIDHIEMAVPISPEELRQKRNSVLKHQSQMESAPFLGDDERLFWQRAEDRNKATADLYNQLGLASYEAIEAFVEYKALKK